MDVSHAWLQRALRGRRIVIMLLCALVVLMVVVPWQLQQNVTALLREKAVEFVPHLPYLHSEAALDLEGSARHLPLAHADPSRTTRCNSSAGITDRAGVQRPLVQYAMMMDAGSTGSRIHIYKFNYCSAMPELESERFEHVEPGLSAYKQDANGAANSMRPLLDAAMRTIPEALHRCAPVQLKATAGLRLLPGSQSKEILKAVRRLLEQEYPFPIADAADEISRGARRGVEIMDGREEGVYAWITVNYLLNLIGGSSGLPSEERVGKSGHTRETAAVLDLGGGSTQIVFEPRMAPPTAMRPGEHIYELRGA